MSAGGKEPRFWLYLLLLVRAPKSLRRRRRRKRPTKGGGGESKRHKPAEQTLSFPSSPPLAPTFFTFDLEIPETALPSNACRILGLPCRGQCYVFFLKKMQAFQPLSAILLHHHKLQNLGIGCRMLPTTRLPPRTIFWTYYRYKQLVYFFRLHFVCNAFPSLSPPQTATVNKIPPPGIKEKKKEGLLARTWDGRSQHKNKPFSPFRNTYRSQRRGREGEVELLSFLPLSTTGAKIVAGVSGDQRNLVFFPSSSFKPCVSEGGIGFRNRLRGSGLGRRGGKRVATRRRRRRPPLVTRGYTGATSPPCPGRSVAAQKAEEEEEEAIGLFGRRAGGNGTGIADVGSVVAPPLMIFSSSTEVVRVPFSWPTISFSMGESLPCLPLTHY